jgi:hypothetical protein
MAEQINEQPLELNEATLEQQPGSAFDYYELDDYAGEIETHYWIPDKSTPQKKIRLDLRTQALTGTQINVIQRKALRSQNAAVEAQYLQQRINQHTMPRQIYRLREELAKVSDIDFDSPEKAEEKRAQIDASITDMLATWHKEHESMNAELEKLLALPTFYETLRAEFFALVIEDHSIAWHSRKIDFSKPMADQEPPDKFVASLRDFIDEVIRRGKQTKRNGSSRRV